MSAPASPQLRCSFFAHGQCKKGVDCPVFHPAKDTELKWPPFYPVTSEDGLTYEIRGALVRFGDDADISSIDFVSEYSEIQVYGFKTHDTKATVRQLLSESNVDVRLEHIRLYEPTEMSGRKATICVPSVSFAPFAQAKLQKTFASDPNKRFCVFATPPLHRSFNFHRLECRKVFLSWPRQPGSASLYFEELQHAYKAEQNFSTGEYRICGTQVTTDPLKEYQHGWEVRLRGVPNVAEEKDVLHDIERTGYPDGVKLEIDMDERQQCALIEPLLSKFGLYLEYFGPTPTRDAKDFSKSMTFLEEADARAVTYSLNNKPLGGFNMNRLTVELETAIEYETSPEIYKMVYKQIQSKIGLWISQHTRFYSWARSRSVQVLSLEGKDRHALAKAKRALERILGGDILRVYGKNIWHDCYRKDGAESLELAEMAIRLGVIIQRDVRYSQLRLFGPEEAKNQVRYYVGSLVRDMTPITQRVFVELQPDSIDHIPEASQQSHLHVDSLVRSQREGYLLDGLKSDVELDIASLDSRHGAICIRRECSFCYNEAGERVVLLCGHVYCSSCFAEMCETLATKVVWSPITCIGNHGRCTETVSLAEVKMFLSSERFERFLEARLISYVKRHPAEFRFCPTPDCTNIYRIAKAPATVLCTNCLASICAACHETHPGVTCNVHRLNNPEDNRSMEEAKKTLQIKDCPQCKTPLEKSNGCDHVICIACGIHICWDCLDTFKETSEYLDHASERHAGFDE